MKQNVTIQKPLLAFGLDKPAVISIIGSGGKTTLMYRLAKDLMQRNKKVITTTTTKIYPPKPEQSPYLVINSKPRVANIQPLLNKYRHITLVESKNNEGKLVGLKPEIVDNLADNLLKKSKLDYILVEADGAKGKSLKGYHVINPKLKSEPVIPKSSKLCILVIGWDVLGKPFNERYVHRAKLLSKLIHAKTNTRISESILINAVCFPGGYISRVPNKCKLIVYINKVNLEKDLKKLAKFCRKLILKSPKPINRIIFGALK